MKKGNGITVHMKTTLIATALLVAISIAPATDTGAQTSLTPASGGHRAGVGCHDPSSCAWLPYRVASCRSRTGRKNQ